MFLSVPFSSFHLFPHVKCSQEGKRKKERKKRKLESCIKFPSFGLCSCMESNVKLIKRERERTFSRFKTFLSSLPSLSLPLLLYSLLHPSLSLSLSLKATIWTLGAHKESNYSSVWISRRGHPHHDHAAHLFLPPLAFTLSPPPSPLFNKLLSLPTLSFTFLSFIGFIHLYSSDCLLLYGVNLLMCHSIHSFIHSLFHFLTLVKCNFITLFHTFFFFLSKGSLFILSSPSLEKFIQTL